MKSPRLIKQSLRVISSLMLLKTNMALLSERCNSKVTSFCVPLMRRAANLRSNTNHVERAVRRAMQAKTELQKRGQSQLFAWRLEKAREMLICLC